MQSVPSAPVDPPNIQNVPSTASPQPEGSNENVLNKGSSTAATPVGTVEALDQQATSPPLAEVLDQQATSPPLAKDLEADEPNTGIETPVINIPSVSSPKKVHFADQSEEESDTNTVSHYFADDDEDEGMQVENADEGMQVEVEVPVPVGTVFAKPAPPTLSEEQKEEMKKSNPLKYLKLMLAQRGPSSSKTQSEDSNQSKEDVPLTSLDQLLQEVNKTILQADLFTILKDNPGAYFSMKNLLSQIDLSICPPEVGETIYDLQILLDEVNNAYIRAHGIEAKIQTKREALSKAYDQTSKLTKEAEA